MNFIKDILSRDMTLKQVASKYNIGVDDILEKYNDERSKYTEEEIEEIMNEVFYK